MSTLSAAEGYRLWAPTYEAETAVSFLEDRLVRAFRVPVGGRRLLDVGCGRGRRIERSGATFAVGVDLTPEMLDFRPEGAAFLCGDLSALPLASDSFDLVWCRLVVGHLPDLEGAYAELARVCRPGGTVIVTDFHADAAAAGHRRTFRDESGCVRELEHFVHPVESQAAVAQRTGLELQSRVDGRIGPRLYPFYARAGRTAAYFEQRGLPLVLALRFRRAVLG